MIIKKKVKDLKEAKEIIENGEIVYTDTKDRGIGKTTSIIEYSNWKEIPIIVGSHVMMKLYEKEGARNILLIRSEDNLLGLEIIDEGYALVDESVSLSVLHGLMNIGVTVSGFYQGE